MNMGKIANLLIFFVSIDRAAAGLNGPLSSDFQSWLHSHNFNVKDLSRSDLGNWASFGGKQTPNDKTDRPVIFIHGNGDSALRNPTASIVYEKFSTGWDNSIEYFKRKGYGNGELYATTWGPADGALTGQQTHNCAYLTHLRSFMEAVLDYTKADKVDIISHSMGVTLSRMVIKGGQYTDEIGGNYGLCACQYSASVATCNRKTGFFPGSCGMELFCGYSYGICDQENYATALTDLNNSNNNNGTDGGFEGSYRYAFFSLLDDVILYGDNVWGKHTSRFPGQTGQKIFTSLTHMESKDDTAADQYRSVVMHQI